MAEPTAPTKGGKENILTKKYGKLKGWQLLGIVAVGGALVLYVIRSRQAAGTTAPVATGDFSSTAPADSSGSPLPGIDGTGLQAAIDQAGEQASGNADTLSEQAQQIAALQSSVGTAQHAADVANNKIAHLPTLAAIKKNIANHQPKAAAKKPPAKAAPKPAPKKPAPKVATKADQEAALKYIYAVQHGTAPAPAGIPR